MTETDEGALDNVSKFYFWQRICTKHGLAWPGLDWPVKNYYLFVMGCASYIGSMNTYISVCPHDELM